MTTIVVPRIPKQSVKSNDGSKKFHTIHIDKHIFTIQHNGTSVVAFRRKSDVIKFSKMIESHFELTREWPVINFDDSVVVKSTLSNRLKYVDIKDWDEDTLNTWCIVNAFSMLDIFSFEDDRRLVGRSIYWDCTDDNFYRSILDEKFKL